MQNNTEKLYDIIGRLAEIKSSLILTQQAVQNDDNQPSLTDIDNTLELIIDKFGNITSDFNKILASISE